MRNVRQRKVIRDLWQNRGRTGLVILSIAVGVFAFGVIAGARTTLLREVNAGYLAINPASATLTIDPFDDDLLDAVRRLPEVADAEGRRIITIRRQVSSDTWDDVELTAIQDYDDLRVSQIYPISGAWPPPKQSMLVERKSLEKLAVGVGDSIIVEVPGGKQRPVQISGLTHDLSRPPTDISGIVFGYISDDTLAWLGLPTSYNALLFTVSENPLDEAHIERVADIVADKVEQSGRTVYRTEIPTPGQHPAEEIMPTILLILGFLGLLALVLSAFLVINTVSAILAQQRQQIGVMKAIGARTGTIVRLYIDMVVIFGVLALLLAVPLGVLGARAFSQFMAGMLNVDIANFRIPLRIFGLEIAVGLLVPIVASLYPILSTARITVREAMSNYGLGSGQFGTSPIDRMLLGIRRVIALSRPLMLSLRNTFRRKARLLLTLITLVLGGAIFISVLTVRASLFNTLDQTLVQNDFDILVRFSRPYRVTALTREVADIPGVAGVEGWGYVVANRLRPDGSEGETLFLHAPPADTKMLDLNLTQGRWLQPEDRNAIVVDNRFLLDEPDLSLGDTMMLEIGDEELSWVIVGVAEQFRPPLSPAPMYVNYPYFAQQVGEVGRSTTLRIVTSPRTPAAQSQVARRLETRLAETGKQVSLIRTITDDQESITERFNILTSILMIMSVLMAVVGGLGLMGTMSINVLERAREIGVMRAIGASNGSVIQLVMVEGVLIGLIAWLAGGLLAIPLSRAMSNQIGFTLFQIPLDYRFSMLGLGIWLTTVVVIASLASFVPAWNAARLTVRAVLAYE